MTDIPTTDEPTIEGFIAFVHNVMGVPAGAQPDDTTCENAFGLAQDLAFPEIRRVSTRLYRSAVYNLAASFLVQMAPDAENSSPPHFWQNLRNKLGISGFAPGIIQSSSDNGTSQTWAIPEGFKNLSLADLDALKNPWGRAYIAIAQQYGTLWALR